MAFVISDRIKETTTTTGTGTITLAGAATGFASFAAVGNANTTGYAIIAVDANGVPTGEWETGIGTYTSSGTTLSRGVIKSSNSNAAVSFAAGTKHVICTNVAGYGTPLVTATTANRAIQVADQTALSSTAGNARGTGAVDLQTKRTYATQVASGNYSLVAGKNSRGNGYGSVAIGISATASASTAVAIGNASYAGSTSSVCIGGESNNAYTGVRATVVGGTTGKATGINSLVIAGANNTASAKGSACIAGTDNAATATYAICLAGSINAATANNSVVIGKEATADKFAQFTHAAGKISTFGDAQRSAFVLRKRTTNNTASEVFLDNSSARLTLSNDTTWAFDGLLVARRTDTDGTNSAWSFSGVIKRDTNAASTALVGTCTPAVIMQDAGAAATAVSITADTTNGSLKFTVTGESGKTYNWVVYLRTVEVTG